MALLSVADARAMVLADVAALPPEVVDLKQALGRTLAEDLVARRTQPPFRASAMDGYALRASDAVQGARLTVIGEAPAGRAFVGQIGTGEAIRIFTGAPVPEGADAVLIQENAEVIDTSTISVGEPVAEGRNIRAAGLDFTTGDLLLSAGTRLDWRTLALAAAMDYPSVSVTRRPTVAVLATGDELVLPGQNARPDQIVASNSFGLAAFIEAAGAVPLDLGIASDRQDDLVAHIRAGLDRAPDILVTLGGVSVGDHDLVRAALADLGLDLSFWKVAMRPGKPLMFGRLGGTRVLGLPGNPVSSMVGAVLFLGPLIAALSGRDAIGIQAIDTARLAAPLKANDSRADYLRATLTTGTDGLTRVTAFDTQDSAMLSRFALSDCLILREPFAAPAAAGDLVRIIRL